jgi:ribosomal protein S12 methylthiotransferase
MLGMAAEAGYSLVDQAEFADILVVNTCSFIEAAKRESIDAILDLADIKQRYPEKKLVVAGCLPQRYIRELEVELGEVDHFVGTGQIPDFASILQHADAPRNLATSQPGWLYSHDSPRMQSTPFYTAYVKIAEGCDRRCAFCAIPSFRGHQQSRMIDSIVEEVRDLSSKGVVEINIIAQELNAYGRDLPLSASGQRADLRALLIALEQIEPGPRWIRLLYLYPHRLDLPLIKQIAQSRRIVPYIDLPLQHICDPILRKMKRTGNSRTIRALLDRLRSHIPNLAIRTTFLVGFPGETDGDFEQLCEFVEEQQFDHLGVFVYSPEEGTAAYNYTNSIDPDIALERQRILYAKQETISESKLRRFVGQEVEVLVEGVSEESELLIEGRMPTQAPQIDGVVFINDGHAPVGTIVHVLIEQSGTHDLVGGIVSPQ